ncbi:6-phospho-3-hexuloisomerase [Robertmurraya sp. FSL R5-0851]|uniref:6-phospho-3-hexuloisomerase n=1 Tax=Robertmurraya sp. FSL R5-0851 TaxID=2921584 RepID=UPI0030F7F4D4
MNITQYLREIVQELNSSVELLPELEAEKLLDAILKSKKILVAGAGRSGLMGKSFAMRMMHMGIDAYVVGETVTANLEPGDLLIIGSGSGETSTLIAIAEKAKKLGGVVALITTSSESTLGRIADLIVPLPGTPKDKTNSDYHSIQPMGSLFEQTMLLFYDSLILKVMEINGLDSNKMYGKHANLE